MLTQQNTRILQLLLRAGRISKEEAETVLQRVRASNQPVHEAIVQAGLMSEEELAQFLAQQHRVQYVDLTKYEVNEEFVKRFPQDFLRKHLIVPLRRKGRRLTVAVADPTNLQPLEDLKFTTGADIQMVVARPSDIQETLDRIFGTSSADLVEEALEEAVAEEAVEVTEETQELGAVDILQQAQAAPVIKFVNGILAQAIKLGASDIHIEPYEKDLRVRFRIDGVLHEIAHPPVKLKDAIVSRVKVMSKLDIAERRLPQDGRIRIRVGGKEVDIRVSTVPVVYGEKVVMRILDKSALNVDLEKLGFEPEALELFKEAIHKPYGMILVTGPTGSGKSTTLYSAMQILNRPEVNIMTAEDPVEFNFHGLNQVNIREEIGLTFASALRAFLRQDPDIILVGEIRDQETASIAIKAALTGHLVLSTLHTNDAPSSIPRLVDMGVEPFLVAASVILVVAQRLVRRICTNCKRPVEYHPEDLREIGIDPESLPGDQVFYKGEGCEVCKNTGYKGRIGIYEVMKVTPEIREALVEGASATEIREIALEQGMITLREAAVRKFLAGVTTREEVLRVTMEE